MAVSVVVPVLNEAKHIYGVLSGLFHQDYNGSIQILVIDGGSLDATPQIVRELACQAPPRVSVHLLDNIKGTIPAALNIGIAEASFEIIIRLDGHTLPPPDYISKCVHTLHKLGPAVIVGGVCCISPGSDTTMAKAIAIGVAHSLGIGNATYRTCLKDKASPLQVDTVPFGAYDRKLWRDLGGYDESLLTAEDYDFNYRARKLNKSVWLLPDVVLLYTARPTLAELAKQYFRYGYWSGVLSIKHRRIPAWRKAIPALFCLQLLVFLFLYLPVFGAVLALYGLVCVAVAINTSYAKHNLLLGAALLLVFPTLHFSYGAGSLLSLHRLLQEEVASHA